MSVNCAVSACPTLCGHTDPNQRLLTTGHSHLKFAAPAMMIPMMTPKSPNALPKISTTRILTNSVASWASDSAALLPTIPTHTLLN